MKYDVFISYSRLDCAKADEITRAFDNAGISYFIDCKGIHGSEEFQKSIASGILDSRLFLFLASKNSYRSLYTKKEVAFALKKKGNSILPYIIDDSELPADLDLAFADINWRTLHDHPVSVITGDILTLLNRKPYNNDNHDIPRPTSEEIGLWYMTGELAEIVDGEIGASEWYRLAAEQGHLKAQLKLARLYDKTAGALSNKQEAIKWYKLAAEHGDAEAQSYLREFYKKGKSDL